jgi:hypothetical protein
MPFIPRQVKAPPRVALTCKVPEAVATMLKWYAEYSEGTQEHVVTEALRLVFRRDKAFRPWLAVHYPETPMPATEALPAPRDPSRPASQTASPTAVTARRVPPAPEPHPQQTDHEPLVRPDRTKS